MRSQRQTLGMASLAQHQPGAREVLSLILNTTPHTQKVNISSDHRTQKGS